LVEKLAAQLDKAGLGGFMCLGRPGLQLLEIPVSEGRFGAVVIGGLNPVSILEKSGHRVSPPGRLPVSLTLTSCFITKN
jgi:repressor of nif and glnA expression